MYRLRSHIDSSLDRKFDCFADLQRYVAQQDLSTDDATAEQWTESGFQVIL